MSNEVRIVQWDETLKQGFFDFARFVHPKEDGLKERMQWFTFGAKLAEANTNLPGLAIVKDNGEIIGQFMMSPFEFHLRQKKYVGYFGYDFFVKEEYRSRGAGALLFVQGVRVYAPFIGVGLTHIVEKISKAAGIQTIGLLKNFVWMRNPVSLSSQFLKPRLVKSPPENVKPDSEAVFPNEVDISGLKFERSNSVPEDLAASCSDEVLEPVRSAEFLKWRFWDCPWAYGVYINHNSVGPLWLVVRAVSFQGMRLLMVVDHRFPSAKPESVEIILKAAKRISEDAHLEGVVVASTHVPMEDVLKREGFLAAGRPSSVIAYLPSEEFSPPVKSIHLTMADSDLDFIFPVAQ